MGLTYVRLQSMGPTRLEKSMGYQCPKNASKPAAKLSQAIIKYHCSIEINKTMIDSFLKEIIDEALVSDFYHRELKNTTKLMNNRALPVQRKFPSLDYCLDAIDVDCSTDLNKPWQIKIKYQHPLLEGKKIVLNIHLIDQPVGDAPKTVSDILVELAHHVEIFYALCEKIKKLEKMEIWNFDESQYSLDNPTEDKKNAHKEIEKRILFEHKEGAKAAKAASQYILGFIYENGRLGVDINKATALEWYRKAAEQRYAAAQHALGWLYENGHGVPQDDAQACEWYRKAADQGHATAQNNLGVMIAHGRGVPQDDVQALEWCRKAVEQGYAAAQHGLGWLYENGRGVPQDDAKACEWYQKAADQGYAAAHNNLRLMLARRGRSVPKDDVCAISPTMLPTFSHRQCSTSSTRDPVDREEALIEFQAQELAKFGP